MPELLTPESRGKRVAPMRRAGVSGISTVGGYVQEHETNAGLTGERKWKTYSELIANVATIGAVLRYFLNVVAKPTWTVEAADDGGPDAERVAEAVEAILYDMERPWYRVVRRAAMFQALGYSIQEWTAKRRDDGLVGLLDVEPRSNATITRWDQDEAGTVHGAWQQSPHDFRELYIPRAKMLYLVDDAVSESPEGLGLLRHAAPAAAVLQAYERIEGIGFETDLQGVPVGRVPYSAIRAKVAAREWDDATAAQVTATMESFVTDRIKAVSTGIVLDSEVYRTADENATPSGVPMWDVKLLSANGTSHEQIARAIDRKVRELARLFGSEWMLLGESGSGSLAMSRDKTGMFSLLVDATLSAIAEQVEKDLLVPLALLNGWSKESLPTLKPEKLQYRDATDLADALETLGRAETLLAPADPAVNVVRTMLGLPEQETIDLALDASLRGARRPEQGAPGAAEDQAQTTEGATASEDTVDTEDVER